MSFLKTAIASAIMLASFAANAENFNFTYSFDNTGDSNPVVITGSLSGDLVGDIINNISNVQVAMNGTAFSGPLFAESWNDAAGNWDNTVAPVISTVATKNNFIFADTDVSTDPGASNYFFYTGNQALAVNFNVSDANGAGVTGYDSPANASWSLVTAPVPEADSYAMILAGFGLLSVLARRRKA